MIKFVFKGDISAYDVDSLIFSPGSGHNLTVSDESPPINRHEITVGKSGIHTWVEINGVEKVELSQATINSIKEIVPTDIIRIEDVRDR